MPRGGRGLSRGQERRQGSQPCDLLPRPPLADRPLAAPAAAMQATFMHGGQQHTVHSLLSAADAALAHDVLAGTTGRKGCCSAWSLACGSAHLPMQGQSPSLLLPQSKQRWTRRSSPLLGQPAAEETPCTSALLLSACPSAPPLLPSACPPARAASWWR